MDYVTRGKCPCSDLVHLRGDETLTLSTFLPHDDELRTKLDWTSQCRGSDGQCYPMLIAVHLMASVDR